MVVSRDIQPIFGVRNPPRLAPWKQNVLKHFVLLGFIFLLCLTLCYGNQVADCCLDTNLPIPAGWKLSLPFRRQLWGWALLTPQGTFPTKNCCCLPQKMGVLCIEVCAGGLLPVQVANAHFGLAHLANSQLWAGPSSMPVSNCCYQPRKWHFLR